MRLGTEERLRARAAKEHALALAREKEYADVVDYVATCGGGEYVELCRGWLERVRDLRDATPPADLSPMVASGISGPFVLVHMRHAELDMEVYLFGERHETPSCPPDYTRIDVYLDNLLRTSDKFIDVFLESSVYTDPSEIRLTSGLAYLRQLFHWCVGERTRCPYPNARIHFNDLRASVIAAENNRYRHYFLDIMSYRDSTKTVGDEFRAWVRHLEAKTELVVDKSSPMHSIARFLVLSLAKIPRIRRNLNTPHIKKKLLVFMCEQFLVALNEQCLVSVTALVLDFYGLARMFKDFGDDVPLTPRRAKNIIMYGGAMHTKTHAKFMEVLGFEVVEAVRYDDVVSAAPMCVDMGSVVQPFFTSSDE